MSYIAISSGHFGPGTGARDIIDEVTEARKVVDRVSYLLRNAGITVHKIVDNQSKTQSQNLNYLIAQHNAKKRDLDVSIHFNASGKRTDLPIGTEVLYRSDSMRAFAAKVSQSIAAASGLKNRGAKKRAELAFLRGTNKPAILIEVCFVNSTEDVRIYRAKFNDICEAIAKECVEFVAPNLSKGKIDLEQIEKAVQNTLPSIQQNASKTIFTSPALKERLKAILNDQKMIEAIVQKGINERAIHMNWAAKLQTGTLTSADLLGLSALIVEHQIKSMKK
ncbi:N-acetylmuramoyl-L-alanine amidase [Ureibacillus sp. FSL K6-8385]|uniref:N-acetylmuramoyl-L-alanine amidase n=1 Tax=Ureibacillus terrenus TaxID=118246 RepID=A0A540V5V3_9BACL|nr:N-acetylmuramoyl-L-alanine amidase [Ureibacillus terrenus]MED3660868.1 N-acetylmuramoyl-L-alanine amidase [Ureibacillus terrenus]MED3764633.1 N-acetylmuramoyl-L-alanine amidase [Ureibacillus terrenus]TQE92150.1 N-acetylmuramoyl-L-alanine amidase [Ureibacillus terrenus]